MATKRATGGRKPMLSPLEGMDDPDSFFHHMQRYLIHLGIKGHSPNTVTSSKVALTRFIRWCADRSLTRPSEIDRALVERYEQWLFFYRKKDGDALQARTRQYLLIPVRQWFSWLVRQGHLPFSPAAELELPKVPRRLPKAVLSSQEAETVLAVPDLNTHVGLRDRAMLEVFYSTGIRRTELSRLALQDVDRARGTIKIAEGKGQKDRMIPIGERALAWIAAYLERARPYLLSDASDGGTLFLNTLGNPLKPTHLTTLVREYVVKSGIGKPGACHLFRHTCATVLLEGGMDTRFIQQILGHASLESTQVYTRVSIQKLKALHTEIHPGKLPEIDRHGSDEQTST